MSNEETFVRHDGEVSIWEKWEKPPLGIMPDWLWISQRRSDLKEAIVRYLDADKTIPAEWVEEHKRHCEWLNKWEETKK